MESRLVLPLELDELELDELELEALDELLELDELDVSSVPPHAPNVAAMQAAKIIFLYILTTYFYIGVYRHYYAFLCKNAL